MEKIKYFSCLILLLLSLSCHAQRLNCRGEKMVSSIHLVDNSYVTATKIDIVYSYDSNGNLQTENILYTHGKYKTREIRTRVGNTVKVKVYSNYDNHKMGYNLNEEKRIIKEWRTDISDDRVDEFKSIISFEYADNGHLSKITGQRFVRNMNDTTWVESHDRDYFIFDYKNDDCYWYRQLSSTAKFYDDGHSWRILTGERTFYGDKKFNYSDNTYGPVINDTNIDFNLFFYNDVSPYFSLNQTHSEIATEWVNLKSAHILKENKYCKLETKIDEEGNIAELVYKNKNYEKVRKRLTIDYVK